MLHRRHLEGAVVFPDVLEKVVRLLGEAARLYSGCARAKNKMATEETLLTFSVAAKQKLKSPVSEALGGSSNGNPFQIVLFDAGCTVVNSYLSLGVREMA